jgi:NADH dehydrogenase
MAVMILLTGATGFVGAHLLEALLEKGYKIRALILPDERIPFNGTNLEWIRCDIRDRESLSECLTGVSIVLHLAGIVANSDKDLTLDVNFNGTRNLVDLSIKNKVRKFIFMSAAAAKFKKLNTYGQSKKMAEDYIIASGIPYVILRTALIIGKGCYEFERFERFVNLLPKVLIVFGHGNTIKRPIFIGDVVSSIIKIVDSEKIYNKIYEIASREVLTLNELIDLICVNSNRGRKKKKFHIPLGVSLFFASVSEKLLKTKSPITKDILIGLNEDVVFDIETAVKELEINPISTSEALYKFYKK